MSRRVCLRLRHELKSVSLNYLGRPEPSAGRSRLHRPHQPPAMASLLCAFSLLHHPPCREYVEGWGQQTTTRIAGNFQSLNPWYTGDDKCQVQYSRYTSLHLPYLLLVLTNTCTTISVNFNQNQPGDPFFLSMSNWGISRISVPNIHPSRNI